MIYFIKNITLIAVSTLILLQPSYSQPAGTGPYHFDDSYSTTSAQNASYKGYTEKVNDSFVTTLYASPSVKAATIRFADKAMTQRHGEVTAYHETGDVMFSSTYRTNRLHGQWKSWYTNQQICDSGKLVSSIPDGTWKTWYPDGTLRSVRTFDAYKYQSLLNEIRRNNSRLSFFYITTLNKRNRNALDQHTNARYSYATLPANPVNSRSQNMSLKQLAEINTTPDTQEYLPPFAKGLHHGLYTNYYPNGLVKDSGYYKNGMKDGVWDEWLEDGTVRSTGFYQHGLKRNTWKFYSAAGKLLYYQHYDSHGRPDHAKEFPE